MAGLFREWTLYPKYTVILVGKKLVLHTVDTSH